MTTGDVVVQRQPEVGVLSELDDWPPGSEFVHLAGTYPQGTAAPPVLRQGELSSVSGLCKLPP